MARRARQLLQGEPTADQRAGYASRATLRASTPGGLWVQVGGRIHAAPRGDEPEVGASSAWTWMVGGRADAASRPSPEEERQPLTLRHERDGRVVVLRVERVEARTEIRRASGSMQAEVLALRMPPAPRRTAPRPARRDVERMLRGEGGDVVFEGL